MELRRQWSLLCGVEHSRLVHPLLSRQVDTRNLIGVSGHPPLTGASPGNPFQQDIYRQHTTARACSRHVLRVQLPPNIPEARGTTEANGGRTTSEREPAGTSGSNPDEDTERAPQGIGDRAAQNVHLHPWAGSASSQSKGIFDAHRFRRTGEAAHTVRRRVPLTGGSSAEN
jgi:hypothetical protein